MKYELRFSLRFIKYEMLKSVKFRTVVFCGTTVLKSSSRYHVLLGNLGT